MTPEPSRSANIGSRTVESAICSHDRGLCCGNSLAPSIARRARACEAVSPARGSTAGGTDLMKHQNRNCAVGENVAGDAAKDKFPQPAMAVSARHQEIGPAIISHLLDLF